MRARRSKPRRGQAQRELTFLSDLRRLLAGPTTGGSATNGGGHGAAGEEGATATLVRVARALAAAGAAEYVTVDLAEPLRRAEIAHADLSRLESLRDAAARFVPDEGGHVVHAFDVARTEIAFATTARPLNAPDLDFARGRVRAYVAVPIIVRDRVVSVITAVSTRRRFDRADAAFFEEVAGWVAMSLERAPARDGRDGRERERRDSARSVRRSGVAPAARPSIRPPALRNRAG